MLVNMIWANVCFILILCSFLCTSVDVNVGRGTVRRRRRDGEDLECLIAVRRKLEDSEIEYSKETLDGLKSEVEKIVALMNQKQGEIQESEDQEAREEALRLERKIRLNNRHSKQIPGGSIEDRAFNFPFVWEKSCRENPETIDNPFSHDGRSSYGWCLMGECGQSFEQQTRKGNFQWREKSWKCERRTKESSIFDSKDCETDSECRVCEASFTASELSVHPYNGGDTITTVEFGKGSKFSLKAYLEGTFRFEFIEGESFAHGVTFPVSTGRSDVGENTPSCLISETQCRQLPECTLTVRLYPNDEYFHEGSAGYHEAVSRWNVFIQALRKDVWHSFHLPSQYPNARPAYLARYDAIESMNRKDGNFDLIWVEGVWYRSGQKRLPNGHSFQLQLLTGSRGGEDPGWTDIPESPFPSTSSSWTGCSTTASCVLEPFIQDEGQIYCCCEDIEKAMGRECYSRAVPRH